MMSGNLHHQQQHIRHQKREKKLVLLRIFILLSSGVVEISAMTGLIDSFIFSSPVMIWAQLLHVQRRLYFSLSLCWQLRKHWPGFLFMLFWVQDGNSKVHLSQTAKIKAEPYLGSIEQPSEIQGLALYGCMVWCHRNGRLLSAVCRCYLWV